MNLPRGAEVAAAALADPSSMTVRKRAAELLAQAIGPNAAALAKSSVSDPVKHRKDNSVLATFKGGDLTAAEFLGWVETMPPQMQVSRQLPQLVTRQMSAAEITWT